jgi:type I restriction enzyme S subunit
MEFNSDLPTLPKGWVWTRLGEVSEISSGFGFPKIYQGMDSGEIPFYKVGDISKTVLNGKIYLKEADNYISKEICKKLKAIPIKRDNIVFAKIGEAIKLDRRAILSEESLVDNNVMGVLFIPQGIFYLFGYYFFLTIKLDDFSRATTVPSIRKSDVGKIPFPLPPLPEQHRIVDKIEELFTKLDAGVDALKKIKIQLKRYRQAVLKNAFEGKLTQQWREVHKGELEPASVLLEKIKEQRKKESKGKFKELPPIDTSELPELPEGWVWVKIIDLLGEDGIFIDGDWVETKDQDPNGDVRLIQLADIGDGFYRNRSNRFLTIDKAIQLNCTFLQPNDVLIARMPDPLGRACIFPGDSKPCVTVVDVCIIRPNLRISNKRWLMHMINAVQFRSGIEKLQSGSTRKRISRNNLSKLFLPLSPLPEQHQIVAEIESRLSVADQLEKVVEQSLKQAERLRQSILKKAFEGKLVPQDPTDEPAEKLLERIKEEKENRSLIKQKSRKRK